MMTGRQSGASHTVPLVAPLVTNARDDTEMMPVTVLAYVCPQPWQSC